MDSQCGNDIFDGEQHAVLGMLDVRSEEAELTSQYLSGEH